MSDANALKLVEAAVLVGALVMFVWWQLRDLKKAAAETARRRSQNTPDDGTAPDASKAKP